MAAPVAEDGGVVIPDGEDDVHVLLGNGEPAYLTVDAVDAARVTLMIGGAHDGVDGAWDVPLCGVTLP